MSDTTCLRIIARIADSERPAVIAGAQQLVTVLNAASGRAAYTITLDFDPLTHAPNPANGLIAIILSLLPEVAHPHETIATTEARWHTQLETLLATGVPVFIRNVFRHVADRPRDGSASPLQARIRRLNRMAATLSHVHGVGVIDIDRAFAHIGARALHTDWRMGGPLAAEVAGHTMAWSMLSCGLDDAVEPMLQERARQFLGDLGGIDQLVAHRLAHHRTARAGQ